MWQIDLAGGQADIGELKKLAPHCHCVIAPGHNGRECLSGSRFDGLSTAEEVREQAIKIMNLLNGIARIGWGGFCPVQLGAVSQHRRDGTTIFVGIHEQVRIRETLDMVVTRVDGTTESVIAVDHETQRAKRVIADPKLHEIAEALAGDLTWLRLRIAFEKLCVLISGQTKGWDNTLIKNGYATLKGLRQFKANIQDPRLSGLNAVHGVPDGPNPKGPKMMEHQGLAFVGRLLDTYIARQPLT
jgi:hypothetical protein